MEKREGKDDEGRERRKGREGNERRKGEKQRKKAKERKGTGGRGKREQIGRQEVIGLVLIFSQSEVIRIYVKVAGLHIEQYSQQSVRIQRQLKV